MDNDEITDEALAEKLNLGAPPSNRILGGIIRSLNQNDGTCSFEFSPSSDVVNAAGLIGAGYITQMLDQSCAIAGIAKTSRVATTLEIKTNCIKAIRPERFVAEARVVHSGRSIAFIESILKNAAGEVVATASMTANLIDMVKLREKSGST